MVNDLNAERLRKPNQRVETQSNDNTCLCNPTLSSAPYSHWIHRLLLGLYLSLASMLCLSYFCTQRPLLVVYEKLANTNVSNAVNAILITYEVHSIQIDHIHIYFYFNYIYWFNHISFLVNRTKLSLNTSIAVFKI